MKTKILTLILVYLFCWISIQSQEAKTQEEAELKPHFRQARWGMSKEQIIELEGKPTEEDKKEGLNLIVYDSEIDNKRCAILFIFAEDKLVRTKYHFLHNHINKNLYIHDYRKIRESLIGKYAEPKENKTVWLNNLYKNDPDDWGRAIGYGHLRYFAKWEMSETSIFLNLSGDNRKINLTVEYTSIELAELEKKVKEKANKKIW